MIQTCSKHASRRLLLLGTTMREAHVPIWATDSWRAWEAIGSGRGGDTFLSHLLRVLCVLCGHFFLSVNGCKLCLLCGQLSRPFLILIIIVILRFSSRPHQWHPPYFPIRKIPHPHRILLLGSPSPQLGVRSACLRVSATLRLCVKIYAHSLPL